MVRFLALARLIIQITDCELPDLWPRLSAQEILIRVHVQEEMGLMPGLKWGPKARLRYKLPLLAAWQGLQ